MFTLAKEKNLSHNKISAGSLGFTALFALIIVFFNSADVWGRYFDKPGIAYLSYNIERVIFLFYFAWISFYVGKLFLCYLSKNNKDPIGDRLDYFLMSSYLGAASLNVAMFLLGICSLYYLPLILFLVLPIILFSYVDLKDTYLVARAYLRRKNRFSGIMKSPVFILVSIISLEFLYLFVIKGMLPDRVNNDSVGHYLPYYSQVLKNHGIWAGTYFYHFFLTKGYGIIFLGNILTDIQSSQLVVFYFFFLSSLVLFNLIRNVLKNALWGGLAVLVYFSTTSLLLSEFQKPHIILGSVFIFFLYLIGISYNSNKIQAVLFKKIQYIMLIALVIMSPIFIIILLPSLLLQLFVAVAMKRKEFIKHFLYLISVLCVLFMGAIAFNFRTVGILEWNPAFLQRFNSQSILQHWVSPTAVMFQNVFNEGWSNVNLSNMLNIRVMLQSFQGTFILYFDINHLMLEYIKNIFNFGNSLKLFSIGCIGIFALFLAFLVWIKRLLDRRFVSVFPFVLTAILVFVLSLVVVQPAFFRYAFYLDALKVVILMIVLYSLSNLLPQRIFKLCKVSFIPLSVIFLVSNFISSIGLSKVQNGMHNFSFLSGKRSYGDLYEEWPGFIKLGLAIQDEVGPGNNIFLQNFLFGLSGMPKSQFERQITCAYNKTGDFENIMFGAPEIAAASLKKYNINYVLILTTEPFLFAANAPLFEPENLRIFFKVVEHRTIFCNNRSEDIYLLGWKGQKDASVDDIFLDKYKRNLALSKRVEPIYYQTYERVRRIYNGEEKFSYK